MACAALVMLSAPAQVIDPPRPPEVGIDQKLDNQVPLGLTFNDESGNPVRLGELFSGKPVVLSLVYLQCPMLCGEVMQGMLKAFNELELRMGQDYQVITVSFNPKETYELAVAKKKNLLEHFKTPSAGAAGWRFLTGGKENIDRLAQAVGFRYQYLPSTGEYAHASGIMVLTPQGKVSKYFYGIGYSAPDLRLGLVEASNGRIGSLADAVTLLCYRYDPQSGSYAFSVMRAMRIGAVLTVVGLATMVGTFLWQERRQRRRDAAAQSAHGTQPAPTD
jgi:protein SCO1/2